MQEADEQDTCRICSAPAEPDQPLFHPCKCSGTIRYIHQDCLTTWLAHSKKKNCDVCKHPYSFTKVYAPDMPSSLPPVLLLRRLAQHFLLALLFVLRAMAVASIWLGVLPWVTVWTWRMYFSMGESTAWWISDRPRPPTTDSHPFYNKIRYEPTVPHPESFVGRITAHPIWLALSADIFTGQIIASLIVLTFVAVFLLREWISQNARPGVFEDEEVLPEEPAPVQPQPEQPARREPPMRLVFPPQQPRRALPPLPPVQAPPPDAQPPENAGLLIPERMDALLAMETAQRQNFNPVDAANPDRWGIGEGNEEAQNRRLRKKKNKAKQSDIDEDRYNRHRRKLADSGDDAQLEIELMKRKMFHKRIHVARTAAARRRVYTNSKLATFQSPSPPLVTPPLVPPTEQPKQPSKFDFTFKAPTSIQNQATSGPSTHKPESSNFDNRPFAPIPSQQSTSSSTSAALNGISNNGRDANGRDKESWSAPPASPFPSVALQPPSGGIPFSLTTQQSSSSSPPPPPYPSRPPLPTVTLSRSGSNSPFIFSPGKTPIASPSLATYRAPEELEAEAGPSNYFDHKREEDRRALEWAQDAYEGRPELDSDEEEDNRPIPDSDDDMEAERNRYFKAAEDDHENGGTPPGQLQVFFTDSEDESEDGEHQPGEGGDDRDRGAEEFQEGEDDEEEGPPGLFDDLGPWDEGGAAEDVQGGQDAQGAPAPAAGANQAADADAAAALEMNEEADGNVDDDMEGAMEAIGMRGPIFGVFQNAALMIFVLDTAIGLCIWIPFTIGKTAALLSLDPHRLLQVLHLPIRAMRLVTDPIVDFVAFILVDLILPRIIGVFSMLFSVIMFLVSNSVGQLFSKEAKSSMGAFSSKILNESTDLLHKPLDYFTAWTNPANLTEKVSSDSNATLILMAIPDHLGFTEPYFAVLGSEVRELTTKAQSTWIRLALGSGPANRCFAVFLGYVVVAFLLSLYLNILTVGNAKTAGIAVRNAVRQQLLVVKVAAFIFIELVIFPLGCGIVLDLCTVWLFPEANLQSRAAFFSQAPLTAMFYHWVAGTMFMYTFAVLLSGCRTVMRPGAMWFIKDPQDQNSHPIRDILDRPTLVQLRKIFVSGLMYSFVVACVVGSVAGLLLVGTHSIMPFRWKNREPLSNVPIDLLFLHLVLPYTMHYFRPKRAIKEIATVIWKFLATRLRLTSYFFGGRYPEEEHSPKRWQDNFIRSDVYVTNEDTVPDGSFRRVPATDHLALPRDMRATVAVTAEGVPIDDAARELMMQQNVEAEKAKHSVQDDYMIVYIPPHFRFRIIAFIILQWMVGAVIVGFAGALPILLGRSFFRLFTAREVHDGYSLIVGFYLLWACYLIVKAVDRLDKRRQRRGGDGPRANLHVLVVKRGLLWAAKTVYMMFFMGVVIPVLLAVVVDLYVVLPIRFTVDPTMVPRMRVVDSWALGMLYAKIALHAHRIQPPTLITRGLQHLMMNGWTRPDPIRATKEVIAPLTGGLLGMILFPGVLFCTMQHFLPNITLDNRFIFMHVYPSVFVLAGSVRSAISLYDILAAWSQSIRDKEFLVEMRLRNHEPEVEKKEKGVGTEAGTAVGRGVGTWVEGVLVVPVGRGAQDAAAQGAGAQVVAPPADVVADVREHDVVEEEVEEDDDAMNVDED